MIKNLILQIVVVAGFSFGLYFYCRGFLLSRSTLGKQSACSDGRISSNDYSNFDSSDKVCWVKPRFRRAIWIVMDALRYDFIAPVTEGPINEYYHNKLSVVGELLARRPLNSLLYKFVADPPTTTLQRLKGLTTGSLPTFIDAGQNFGGSEIDEDNLMDQFVRRGKNITFLGDDTWTALFPTQFARSFPFPSFDVKDLHTVDNGILEHLWDELKSEDTWDILIAHFLGVDHCGHRYGPNHPEMTAKLEQMDQVLRGVVETMDSETVLFVLGDHGMTQTGDHGGDSEDELNAALFVYSPGDLHRHETNIGNTVRQVDIVPTMALLMDVPIPFSNLGKLLLELFPDHDGRSRAVEANILQVFRYTEMYLANFRDQVLSDRLQPIFNVFYAHDPDELTPAKSMDYIDRISRVFTESWAKFHVGWMALGMVTLLETFLWLISFLLDPQNTVTARRLMLKAAWFALSSWVVLAHQETIPPMLGILCGLLVIFHAHTILVTVWQQQTGFTAPPSFPSLFAGFLLVAHGLSQFSNSFIIYENNLAYYFSASLIIVLFFNSETKSKSSHPKQPAVEKKRRAASGWSKFSQVFESRWGWKRAIYCALCLIALRLVAYFVRCREEQYQCSSSIFTLPFAGLLDDNLKVIRVSVSLGSLVLLYWLLHQFFAYNGHLSGHSVFCTAFGFGHTLMAVWIAVYWILQWLPQRAVAVLSNTSVAYLAPPLLCYAIFVVIILANLVNPLLTSMQSIPNQRSTGVNAKSPLSLSYGGSEALSEKEMVQRAYQHLKVNWRYYLNQPEPVNAESNDEPRLAVFGLASGYSGPLLAIITTFLFLFALLLEDGFTFPLLGFTLVNLVIVELFADTGTLIFVTLLHELSVHFFYSFGHQPTFASIPWQAAFIGIPGNFRYRWVQGALVVLRLGISQVLVVFILPLKACWRYYWKKLGAFAVRRTTSAATDSVGSDELESEAELIRHEDMFLNNVVHLNCAYLGAAAVRTICSTLASTVHRRHLMVWKIFAPKFIFDGVHFLLTCGTIILQYLLIVRLHTALRKSFSRVQFVRHQKTK